MNDNDTITLSHLLSQLKRLDHNGWATLTDGTLDNHDLSEQIEIVSDAINQIKNNS